MAESREVTDLLKQAGDGDATAVADLFDRYRKRLKRMVSLRISRQIRGRIDDSDILQESYLEASRRLDEYLREPSLPFFLWLRHITGQKLIDAHRRHLGAKKRDAGTEISLHSGALPAANSHSLAAQLLGRLTSPSQAAIKAEMRIRLQEVLNRMDALDREVLALRHFEQLNNREVSQLLGINESAASTRYLRALRRLRNNLSTIPGVRD